MLKEFQQKVYKGEPDIYRKLFTPWVWLLTRLRVHPNVISILRGVNLILAAYFFINEKLWGGALLLQLNIILDISDGALARYFNKQSLKGELIDNVLDHLYSQVLVFVPLLLISWKWFVVGVLLSHVSVYLRAICMEVNNVSKLGKFVEKLFRQDNNRFLAFLVLLGCTTQRPAEGIALLLLVFIIIKVWVLASYLVFNGVNFASPKLAFNYLCCACYYVTRKDFFKKMLDMKYNIVRYTLEHKA